MGPAEHIDDDWTLYATSPAGRGVRVVVVHRGMPLRLAADQSGQLAGMLAELAFNGVAVVFSFFRRGWTIGVVSMDIEPWLGERVLYRERSMHEDPRPRMTALHDAIINGELAIPQPREWLNRRKPTR